MKAFFALLCVGLLATFATAAATAGIVNPGQFELTVQGGAETWEADYFTLSWQSPFPPAEPVFFRLDIVDESGGLAYQAGGFNPISLIDGIHLPRPGVYTARVTYEDSGRASSSIPAGLRFDNAIPAPPRALAPSGWIVGGAPARLRVEPAAVKPLSGIRGFAAALQLGDAAAPCAGSGRCDGKLELDGDGGGVVDFGVLPEGVYTAAVVAVSGSDLASPAASAQLRVDSSGPEIGIAGIPAGWSNGPVRVLVTAVDPISGMAAAGAAGPFTSVAVDGGIPSRSQGDTATATVSGDGVHTVATAARDVAGNLRGGDSVHPAPSARVRIDETAPRVAFSVRPDPAEPERIEASVDDRLSGPSSGRGTIAVRAAGSGRPFEPLPTTVSGGTLSALWDSDSYPHGRYEFRAVGFDAAGNSAASERRADGEPMLLSNPIKTPTVAHFGFGGRRLVWHRCVRSGEERRCRRQVIVPFDRRPDHRTVPYGRALAIGGRLATAAGAPLAHRAVTLVESFDPGARPRRRATVVETAGDGTFLAHLEAGPNRRVEALFAGDRLLTKTSSRALRLSVLTAVSFRASSSQARIGGEPVRFSGRVGGLGAEIPEYGRPVQLQFRLAGGEWTEFRSVQTDALGRFRYPYSFSDDDSRGIRFQFRAFAPAQPNWPYVPGVSRPVAVTGH